jgi:hypothetical protein
MEANPIRNDARKARRSRLLGPDAACVRCGLTNQECLIPTKRSLFEAHHVAGNAHDDRLTVPLCRNCHAVLTEGQRDAGVDFLPQPTVLHRIAAALASLAVFFADLAATCLRWSTQLGLLVDGFDAEFPAWRTLAAAQIGAPS